MPTTPQGAPMRCVGCVHCAWTQGALDKLELDSKPWRKEVLWGSALQYAHVQKRDNPLLRVILAALLTEVFVHVFYSQEP